MQNQQPNTKQEQEQQQKQQQLLDHLESLPFVNQTVKVKSHERLELTLIGAVDKSTIVLANGVIVKIAKGKTETIKTISSYLEEVLL